MTNSPQPPRTSYRPTLGDVTMDVLVQLPGNEPIKVGRVSVPIYALGAGDFRFDVRDEIRAVEEAAREALGKFAIVEVVEEEPKVMTAGEIVANEQEKLAQPGWDRPTSDNRPEPI